MRLTIALVCASLAMAVTFAPAQDTPSLCPNPGFEEATDDGRPLAWAGAVGSCTWAEDEVHSGKRSLKLSSEEPIKAGWTSDIIPLPHAGWQFALSFWAKADNVHGGNGVCMIFYYTDEKGENIGAQVTRIGGAGDAIMTTPWQQHFAVGKTLPEARGLRIHVRLYRTAGTVWLDDFELREYDTGPLRQARSLRRGLRLSGDDALAIVASAGDEALAQQIQTALQKQNVEAPIIPHDKADLLAEKRDLIVLGNLATSKAMEYLYLQYYTYADLYFPGAGGYVLRPLIDPLGTGTNILVVAASDADGLQAGVAALLSHIKAAQDTLDFPLIVKTGPNYKGIRSYPWPGPGPYREMKPAGEYLKSGDLEKAREYRDYILKQWLTHTDESLANRQSVVHLIYHSMTMSWDLMESSGVFSDEERLTLTNQLLKVMRSNQAAGYTGINEALFAARSRSNHDIRNARSFYFGWRYFDKYYGDALLPEVSHWRWQIENFFKLWHFTSFRTGDGAISQHTFAGSMNAVTDVGFMEPEWSREFFEGGNARLMGDWNIAVCNNMGQAVMLGDAGPGDYPSGLFAKLGYYYRDGRYQFMIDKRGQTSTHIDEPMRAFVLGLKPQVPADHIGLKIIPADRLYFDSMLLSKAGVAFGDAFDKISFRSGFDAADEYMLLEGLGGGGHAFDDANTIAEFSANGRRWLCEPDIFLGPTMSFHNAVTVARGGLGVSQVPEATELLQHSSGDDYAYTATRLPRYNGAAWTRHILWLPGPYTFVLDELTAEEAGDYSFVLAWRSLGKPELTPGHFVSAQDGPPQPGLFFDAKVLADAAGDRSGERLYHRGENNVLFYGADTVGDFAETEITAPAEDEYQFLLTFWAHSSRGIVQVSVDGDPLGEPLDMYQAEGDSMAENVLIGKATLTKGPHTIGFSVVGQNPAATGYLFGIRRLQLSPTSASGESLDHGRNRFYLRFPEDLSASLDRDTEMLGAYVPVSTYHDQAINVLEQSMNRNLKTGETACFQNVFCATAGTDLKSLELRHLNDHCALVRCDDDIALIGAATESTSAHLGQLQATGKMFCISPTSILLHEATAKLAGRPLRSSEKPDAAAIRKLLQAAWKAAETAATAATSPWENVPQLQAKWTADIADEPLSLAACRSPQHMRLAVGTATGQVRQFSAAGKPLKQFATGGPVHALCYSDLDGNGSEELIAGSDDNHAYALDAEMSQLWSYEPPFLIDGGTPGYATLYSSKVRKVHTGDITGDGRPEIFLGAGNMRLHCLSAAGTEMWRFVTAYGVPTAITTADVFSDGKQRVVVGPTLKRVRGICWVLDETGKTLQTYAHGSWGSNVQALAVADLNGDGKKAVFWGGTLGDVSAWAAEAGKTFTSRDYAWVRNLTRPIRSLTVVPRGDGAVLAVGSDSGYLCAFDEAGEKVWGTPLSSAITHTALVRRGQEPPRLAAACRDGKVFLLSAEGELLACFDAGGRPQNLTAADLDGDASEEVLVLTSKPNRLHAITAK